MRWPVEIEWTSNESGTVYLITGIINLDDPNFHSIDDMAVNPPLLECDQFSYLSEHDAITQMLADEAQDMENSRNE